MPELESEVVTPPGLSLTDAQAKKVKERMETDGVSRLDAIRQRLPRSAYDRHVGHHSSEVATEVVDKNRDARLAREAEPTLDVDATVDLLRGTAPRPADESAEQDHQAA